MLKNTILLLIVLGYISWTTQKELQVGSVCDLHNGQQGICKNSRDCRWVHEKLQKNEMTLGDIKRCFFVEYNNDIICCGDEQPNKPSAGNVQPKPCYTDFVFDASDCSSEDTSNTDVVEKIGGSKITEACNRYSSLATVLTDNIINGKVVGLGEYPHMAALGYANEQGRAEYDFNCGATLIADNWVMSAAHCIKESRKPVMVRMGKVALLSDEDDAVAIDRKVAKIVRHPEYSSIRKKNDIALIQFDGTVDFNDIVRPACIRIDTADIPTTQELIIAGWGSVDAGRESSRPSILLKTNVSMIPLNECNRTLVEYNQLSNQPSLRALSESQICALNPNDNSDACQGDSGGPLFIAETNGISTIVGVISFGISCGSQLPGVYTRVASYKNWIESVIWP